MHRQYKNNIMLTFHTGTTNKLSNAKTILVQYQQHKSIIKKYFQKQS